MIASTQWESLRHKDYSRNSTGYTPNCKKKSAKNLSYTVKRIKNTYLILSHRKICNQELLDLCLAPQCFKVLLFLCIKIIKSENNKLNNWTAEQCCGSYTAKTQYRRFGTNIPRKKMRGHSPNSNSYIHVSVSERFIYSQALSAYLLQESRRTDHGNIDTWMSKLGLRPRNSFSGITWIKISLRWIVMLKIFLLFFKAMST